MRVLVTVTSCRVFSKTKHLPAVIGTTSALSCTDRVRMNHQRYDENWKRSIGRKATHGAVKLFLGDKLTSITMRPALLPPIFMSKKTLGFAIALVVKREICEITQYQNLRSNLRSTRTRRTSTCQAMTFCVSPTLLGCGGQGKEEWGEHLVNI